MLQEIETNFILTVYGKDDFDKYFTERITPERVIYYNEEQGRKLEVLAERHLLRCHPVAHDLVDTIIRFPQCIDNLKAAGQSTYALDSEAKTAHEASRDLGDGGTPERMQRDER